MTAGPATLVIFVHDPAGTSTRHRPARAPAPRDGSPTGLGDRARLLDAFSKLLRRPIALEGVTSSPASDQLRRSGWRAKSP